MKITLLILTIFLMTDYCFSQSDTSTYRFVDEMPLFMDSTGLVSFHNYLNQHIDLSQISDNLISGKLIVQFCVDSVGMTSDIKIVKSLRDDFDKAVIDVIKESPKRTPGKKNGKPVKVLFTMPMNFDFQ